MSGHSLTLLPVRRRQDSPVATAVLLTSSDVTARQRLAQRETGSALPQHIERSDVAPRQRLAQRADGRTVDDIAAEVIALTGWLTPKRALTSKIRYVTASPRASVHIGLRARLDGRKYTFYELPVVTVVSCQQFD